MEIRYPVYKPYLIGNEKKYVNECIDSTWISSKGEFIKKFKDRFSEYIGINHSITVCNGTVGLHLAVISLGIGINDEVIVPSFTYIASVNAITYSGAKPIFVDSDIETWQLDIEDVKRKITNKTKAILAVHLYGNPCKIVELQKICKENGIFLIEDCAEALGAKCNEKFVGTFGDVSAFSFFGNKTITTGEGGMVATNIKELSEKIVKLKGQGLSTGNIYYWHDILGYNYRMTNICAALGFAQMENIDEIINRKRKIAEYYKNELRETGLILHHESGKDFSTYWMYSILTESIDKRNCLIDHLKKNGIETRPFFYPVHRMPMYNSENSFPVADALSQRGINLPSYPGLNYDDICEICFHIKEFLK
ncbi:MAG: DegT/DnrJ/EryC1/StrS family aminotransferase [Bacteroidota bacterium]|nr:DegT/DnrJ/EryC1/StrS family aminotransferase [Bacteroidota bacterium]